MIKTTCNLDNVSNNVVNLMMAIYSKDYSKITFSFIVSSESKLANKLVVLSLKELVVYATNFPGS
jgi:hypothetical protein